MDSTLPWYQSAIVRQQITQVIVALTALFGVNLGGLDVDATLVNIFGGIAALIAVYTLVTRIFKPAPNLSQTAVQKEIEMVSAKKIPASPTGPAPSKQGGFFRPLLVVLIALASAGLALSVLSGCAGTKAAYGSAKSLPDTAYVVVEHYAALVHEAADLAQLPTTDETVKASLKAAVAASAPYVLGDAGRPGIQTLSKRYAAVQNAQTQAELQTAVNAAVLEVAKLINAVKAARRQ